MPITAAAVRNSRPARSSGARPAAPPPLFHPCKRFSLRQAPVALRYQRLIYQAFSLFIFIIYSVLFFCNKNIASAPLKGAARAPDIRPTHVRPHLRYCPAFIADTISTEVILLRIKASTASVKSTVISAEST